MRADGSRQRPLPMSNPGFDVEPRWSPDGKWIAFDRLRIRGDEFSQAAFIVKARGGRARRLTPWPENAEHPTWSPDSRWIIYNTSPNGTVKVVRPSGRDHRTIVREAKRFGGHKPQFSPDGRHILFMCENQGTLLKPPSDYDEDLCVMNADGSDVVNITNTPDTPENWPSWGSARRP
jgi:Tol biopolymer transport system component